MRRGWSVTGKEDHNLVEGTMMMYRWVVTMRLARIAAFAVTVVSVAATVAQATNGADKQFTVISTEQLQSMVEGRRKITLIDARTKEEYQEAHIKGAISIPEKTFDDSIALLPTDRNALLVFYCNGVKCGKSKNAAIKAAVKGFTTILVYGEGFPVWEEKGYPIVPGPDYAKKVETARITPAELKRLIDANVDDFILVDVRDESEYKEGHIPTALNIPSDTFASRSGVLPKEKKIIVYCNTGGRSYTAYRKLMKLGYPSIAQTLFADWKTKGMTIEQ